jgi:hypothetical protein
MSVSYNGANIFDAPCAVCRARVPKGLGILGGLRPNWTVHCQRCFEAAREVSPLRRTCAILALLPDDRVSVSLDRDKVPREDFDRYLNAAKAVGFFWNPDFQAQVGEVRSVPALIKAVQDAGFDVKVIDPKLTARLQEKAEEARADVEGADERADITNKLLAKRNLKLYDYQRKSIQWLSARKTGLLGHDPGLGKTIISLVALPNNAPVLVISPAVAKGVWLREICNWRPDYGSCSVRTRAGLDYLEPEQGITVLEGRGSFVWPRPGEIVITNYDILPVTPSEHADAISLLDEWERRGKPESFRWTPPGAEEGETELVGATEVAQAERLSGMSPVTPPPEGTVLIADEAHIVRTRKSAKMSNRARRFRALAEYVRAEKGRSWLLTGTPMLNEPTELWAVLVATGCAKDVFGTRKRFDSLFRQNRDGTWTPHPSVPELLKRCMFRYSKHAVLKELPPKTREHVAVRIKPEDKEALDALLADVEKGRQERFEDLFEGEQEKYIKADEKRAKALEKRQKKAQEKGEEVDEGGEEEEEPDEATRLKEAQEYAHGRAQDFIPFNELSKVRAILANAKIPAALRIVQEYVDRGEPIVVFADHIEPVQAIYEKFGREAGGWALITGAISPRKRSAIEETFQRGNLRGVAGTIGASGVAITLTRATTAIFIEETWTPALNLQAQDRIHRIGQFKNVTIKVLVADHEMDRKIAAINKKKIELIEAVIGAASMDPEAVLVTEADDLEGAAKLALEAEGACGDDEAPVLLRPVPEPTRVGAPPQLTRPGAPPPAPTRAPVPPRAPAPPPAPERPPAPAPAPAPGVASVRRKGVTAREEEIGFMLAEIAKRSFGSPGDQDFGASIYRDLLRGGLTDKQWAAADRMLSKYGVLNEPAEVRGKRTSGGGPPAPRPGGAHPANTAVEKWAAGALASLAACDQDRACQRNDMGFSKFDGDFGHSLAEQIRTKGGLTDKQWAAAIKLASKYRRQVGAAPGAGKNPHEQGMWHVVVVEPIRGRKLSEGITGQEDVRTFVYESKNGEGSAVQRFEFPKALYEPEEAADWASLNGFSWIRVEG